MLTTDLFRYLLASVHLMVTGYECISSLEYWRYNDQHTLREDYQNCPVSRVSLRDDSRIPMLEPAALEKEPERIAEAQSLKAIGALSGAFLQVGKPVKTSYMLMTDLFRYLRRR
jgi:hypothetical protein